MITTDELRAIPLFSTLADKELAYLARTAADIQLSPGEYAVHEGETRAFFAVIEGKLEVTKIIDGVETVIGIRGPGELFGEVPMVLNTPFLASMRAVEPSRVTAPGAKRIPHAVRRRSRDFRKSRCRCA